MNGQDSSLVITAEGRPQQGEYKIIHGDRSQCEAALAMAAGISGGISILLTRIPREGA